MSDQLEQLILARLRDVPDFPEPGILFKDITPLLADPVAFRAAIDGLAEPYAGIDVVVGIEARGFILGAPVALELGAAFVPLRKRGKLPWRTVTASYQLEYGSAEIELHADAVVAGQRVLIVDDVLATGGTAAAAAGLVTSLGGTVAGIAVLIELAFLSGRDRLGEHPLHTLVSL